MRIYEGSSGSSAVALTDALAENRDTLVRGLVLLVGGVALVLAASMVGYGSGKTFEVVAGVLGFGGLCAMFLGFFLYLLPPLLPSK